MTPGVLAGVPVMYAEPPDGGLVELPAEVQARWKALSEPVAEEWAKSVPGGDKVLAAFQRIELAILELDRARLALRVRSLPRLDRQRFAVATSFDRDGARILVGVGDSESLRRKGRKKTQ